MAQRGELRVVLMLVILLVIVQAVSAATISLRYPNGADTMGAACLTTGYYTQCTLDRTKTQQVCDQEGQYWLVHAQPGAPSAEYTYPMHYVQWETAAYCRGIEADDYSCMPSSVDFLDAETASKVVYIASQDCTTDWSCTVGEEQYRCGHEIGECGGLIPAAYPLSVTSGYAGEEPIVEGLEAMISAGGVEYHLCTDETCPPEGSCVDPESEGGIGTASDPPPPPPPGEGEGEGEGEPEPPGEPGEGEGEGEPEPPGLPPCPEITYSPWTMSDHQDWQGKDYTTALEENTRFRFRLMGSCDQQTNCVEVLEEQTINAGGFCCGSSYNRPATAQTCTQEQTDCGVVDYNELTKPHQYYPYTLTRGSPYNPDTSAFDELIAAGKMYYAKCSKDRLDKPVCDFKPWTQDDVDNWMDRNWGGVTKHICFDLFTAGDCDAIPGFALKRWNFHFFEAIEECQMEEVCVDAVQSRDCGLIIGSNVCGQQQDPIHWGWASLVENRGDIIDYHCANASVVSDGTNFYGCGEVNKLTSPVEEFKQLSISDGATTHGYLCAELGVSAETSQKKIIECVGDTAPIDTWPKASTSTARTGNSLSPELLFDSAIDGTTLTRLQAEGNVNPTVGRVELTIKPNWDGSDTTTRTFLSLDEKQLGDGGFIRVRKTDTNVQCMYSSGTPIGSVDISDLEDGEDLIIIVQWNTGLGTFSCEINGETISSVVSGALALEYVHVGAHPNSQEETAHEPTDGQVTISIFEQETPSLYYCAKDGRYLTDLDLVEPNSVGEATCTAAGLAWTGTKCCSEYEDNPGEYYNDIGGLGACWDSQGYFNGFPAQSQGNRVMPVGGEWYGCNLEESDERLAVTDLQSGDPLVQNNATCDVFLNIESADNNYVCSAIQDQWVRAPTTEPYTLKDAHPDMVAYGSENQSECCGENSCWSGTACVGNQINDPTNTVHEGGYRCINGDWIHQNPKRTWDRANTGYCPEETDCLVSPSGDASKNYNPDAFVPGQMENSPACVADGQSVLHYMCENGDWSSRTKLIALQLLELAQQHSANDYALFCDTYDEIVNFLDYEAIPNAGVVEDYLTESCTLNNRPLPCADRFCALKYQNGGEKVAFGVALNVPIDATSHNFLEALGYDATTCDNVAPGTEAFTECTNRIWYSSKINSLIYVPLHDLNGMTFSTLKSTHQFQVQDALTTATSFFADRASLKEQIGFIEESNIHDRIYVLHKGGAQSRDFYGYFGLDQYNNSYSKPESYIVAKHTNFPGQEASAEKWCDTITSVVGTGVRKDCSSEGGVLRFVLHSEDSSESVREELKSTWRDLTAKLRVI